MIGILIALFLVMWAGAPATLVGVAAVASATPDLAARVADLEDGTVAFTYAVRDGVTGNCRGLRVRLGAGTTAWFHHGYYDSHEDLMAEGPAHFSLRVRSGEVVDVDIIVACDAPQEFRADLDLGEVDPSAAAHYLLGLVGASNDRVADTALLGAAIARDADIVLPLLAFAHDRLRPGDLRSDALYWLVILASERTLGDVLAAIDDDTEDLEYREHAVFTLGQLDRETSLPLLLEVARHHADPRLRSSALFCMAQFEDEPEVLALLEELLLE